MAERSPAECSTRSLRLPVLYFSIHKSTLQLSLVTTNATADFLSKADAMYFCFFALAGQAEQRNAEEGHCNEGF
jgi:hypothetical protein